MNDYEMIISLLKIAKDKNTKAEILQAFIQVYGPIPNDMADEVREAMESK